MMISCPPRLRRLDTLLASEATGAARGDETRLGARGLVPAHGRGVADVLVVTTTVGVLHGVHRHTSDLGPRGTALHLELVCSSRQPEHGLVAASAARNLANSRAAARGNGLLRPRGELDAGEAGVGVVRDEDAVLAGRLGEHAAVAQLRLDVADDGASGMLPTGSTTTSCASCRSTETARCTCPPPRRRAPSGAGNAWSCGTSPVRAGVVGEKSAGGGVGQRANGGDASREDGLNDVFLGFRPARSAPPGRERLGGDTHLREGGTAPRGRG